MSPWHEVHMQRIGSYSICQHSTHLFWNLQYSLSSTFSTLWAKTLSHRDGYCKGHGLSQQEVWVPFWTPKPLKSTPQDTQIFCVEFLKNLNFKLIIEFFYLLIMPMTLINDIMPYFDKFIHVLIVEI